MNQPIICFFTTQGSHPFTSLFLFIFGSYGIKEVERIFDDSKLSDQAILWSCIVHVLDLVMADVGFSLFDWLGGK